MHKGHSHQLHACTVSTKSFEHRLEIDSPASMVGGEALMQCCQLEELVNSHIQVPPDYRFHKGCHPACVHALVGARVCMPSTARQRSRAATAYLVALRMAVAHRPRPT